MSNRSFEKYAINVPYGNKQARGELIHVRCNGDGAHNIFRVTKQRVVVHAWIAQFHEKLFGLVLKPGNAAREAEILYPVVDVLVSQLVSLITNKAMMNERK